MASCPETGVAIPNCSCRSCCEELVATYAPHLLEPAGPANDTAATIAVEQLASNR